MSSASLRTWALGITVLAASPLAGCPHPTRPDGGLDAPAPDAYEEDVYVPPGTDADLDARPRDDAFTLPIDAFSADAWVPLGQDAPFPDAPFPDAYAPITLPDANVPDARVTLPDASFDAGRDGGQDAPLRDSGPPEPCDRGGECPVGRVCVSVFGGDPECRVPCAFLCSSLGLVEVRVALAAGNCATAMQAGTYPGNFWTECAESSTRVGLGFPMPTVGAGSCPPGLTVRECANGFVGESNRYCAARCMTGSDCGAVSGVPAFVCLDGFCQYPGFCEKRP